MSRLTSPARLAGWTLGALALIAVATGLFQQYWVQYPIYSGSPRLYARWYFLFLFAEMLVVLPWGALRGAEVWVRLRSDGHLDEYRRTRLKPSAIVLGALWGGLRPIFWFLGTSLVAGLLVLLVSFVVRRENLEFIPGAREMLAAHALIAVIVTGYSALGQWIAHRKGGPAAATVVTLLILLGSVFTVCGLNPFVQHLTDPDTWLYALLLPNPAAALGTTLGMDLLRFAWVYDHVRALDYVSRGFEYPSPLHTAGVYAIAATLLVTLNSWRLRNTDA